MILGGYACKHCPDHVTTAANLSALNERGLPRLGMLAYIADNRYGDYFSLDRLEGMHLPATRSRFGEKNESSTPISLA